MEGAMTMSDLRSELDAMVNAFDEHPEHPSVDWQRYSEMTKLQEQRLYEELATPHNVPGNPTCSLDDLMDKILS
jgi:hypothetical protein